MKPVYNDPYLNYIKNYLKVYNKKINTDFCGNKIPKKNSQCICLSVILLFSVFTMGINYYSQVFLEKFKCYYKENSDEETLKKNQIGKNSHEEN